MIKRAFPSLIDSDVATLEERCEQRTFVSGQTVIQEGSIAEALYVIVRGKARVMRNFLDNLTAEFTGPLGPGDLLGEISFIDKSGASARIVADGDVTVVALPKPMIDAMIEEDTAFAGRLYHSILMTLCMRLRKTNMRVLPPGDS